MQVLSQPCSQTAKTLMKARRTEHQQAYKITLRRSYNITDIALWCDYIDMLRRLAKDTHNAHFVCPEDLQVAHNSAQRKLQAQREKEAEAQR